MKDEGEKREKENSTRQLLCDEIFTGGRGSWKKNLSNQFGYQFEECWIYICRGVWTKMVSFFSREVDEWTQKR